MLPSREIKEYAIKNGADLIGIASVDRFEGAPDGHRPIDLLTDAKSVIVAAKRIPFSIIDSIPSPNYSVIYRNLNEQLRMLAHNISLFIEDLGFEALQIDPNISDFARDVTIINEKPKPQIKMLGDFSHRHGAVLTGLGEISAASYVVVPNFGPRIRFVTVITTATIEPDPPFAEPNRLCKPKKCGLVCVNACPPKALSGDGTIDHFKCRSYRAPKLCTLEYFKEIARLYDKGLSLIRRISILSHKLSSSELETCGRCLKACPIGITM